MTNMERLGFEGKRGDTNIMEDSPISPAVLNEYKFCNSLAVCFGSSKVDWTLKTQRTLSSIFAAVGQCDFFFATEVTETTENDWIFLFFSTVHTNHAPLFCPEHF